MHRVGAKVNSTRPFHTAKIGIDGDGVEGFCVQQFQEHAAASLGFDGKNAAQPVVESDFQPAARQWFGGNNPMHVLILLQRRDFGRLLIATGQIPRLPQFRAMQCRPFKDERILKAFYQRLRDAGKKPLVALTACMRKLIVLMNRLLKNENFQLAS
jgi:hypothetical protein